MPTLAERYEAQKEARTVQETKDQHPIPHQLKERVDRGRSRMKDGQTERDEILQFWRGNQYVYRSAKGYLLQQDRVTNWETGAGKPPHRMRQVRNMMFDLIAHQVSSATSRVPSFEISPSTSDPEDEDAAALSQKVLLYGYDKWQMRDVALRVVTLALLPGEGFAWPYFDNTVGPYFEDSDGKTTGVGEVKIRVFNGNQVGWESGVRFNDSRWCFVDVAMPEDEVRNLDGYVGGPLVCDAETTGLDKASNSKLVLVTHYLERPSLMHKEGRWLVMANDRVVVEQVPYPCRDKDGVVDEPVLHKLSFITDPEADRDFGLGRHLIDSQRTYNDIWNKMLEWKNLALVPQIFVTPGLMKRQRLTDEPGAIYEIPQPEQNVKWRETPTVPPALSEMLDRTLSDMGRIAAQNDIPSQVESGRAIEPLLERDKGRAGSFYENLAEWWSQLARHCLYLVQNHYSEHDDRILKLQGEWGPDRIEGFKGADLRGQADVRVFAGSLEPRTRQAIEQKVLAFADRGWITPQAAMAAINGGNAESLVDDYLKDVAWAKRLIDKVVGGPELLFAEPMRQEMKEQPTLDPTGQPVLDPMTGQPQMSLQPAEVPAWLPRKFHKVPVIKSVFESWLKTREYERLPPPMREAADTVYEALEQLEQEKAARDAQIQVQMAEGLGMANAAKPQGAKPMPDQPGSGGDGGSPTQNQPPDQSKPS